MTFFMPGPSVQLPDYNVQEHDPISHDDVDRVYYGLVEELSRYRVAATKEFQSLEEAEQFAELDRSDMDWEAYHCQESFQALLDMGEELPTNWFDLVRFPRGSVSTKGSLIIATSPGISLEVKREILDEIERRRYAIAFKRKTRYGNNQYRDEQIYRYYISDKSPSWIIKELARVERITGWRPIKTEEGIRKAVKRYAETTGLDLIMKPKGRASK